MKKKAPVKKLSAAEKAKAIGLPSLDYVVQKANKSRSTLNLWHRQNAQLFDIVLKGCKAAFEEERK